MLEWIRQIFGNWGLAKDAMTNPSETGGDVAQSIIEKLNPALQRIVVLVLIIIALVMGANIGIDYQASKMVPAPAPAPITQEAPANFNLPPAEPIQAIEVWQPTLEPVTLPEAKPAPVSRRRAVQAQTRRGTTYIAPKPNARVSRAVGRRERKVSQTRVDYTYKVYKPPLRHLATSGPGGY
jgi:hypothetical protein